MTENTTPSAQPAPKWMTQLPLILAAAGMVLFVVQITVGATARAWQSYLINLLLFAAISHGAVLFSTLMNTVGARWSGPLADLAEAFTAFFPVSFVLFLILFVGQGHVFPWLHHDLHGKEVWLNLPFMLARDAAGLLLLYGFGLAYLYHALYFKFKKRGGGGVLATRLLQRWEAAPPDEDPAEAETARLVLRDEVQDPPEPVFRLLLKTTQHKPFKRSRNVGVEYSR